ncbi:PAS domain S-box protein [Croceicoccus bisphenolivorans]|uniref:PAS domain S-box protein n=1 Tax=Croceicoccus bisphenolivorans TaxID=1783232 RepID=UPI0009EEF52B|nr:PAS domain S-box protein [Croceicoccus bisphenolivorans]
MLGTTGPQTGWNCDDKSLVAILLDQSPAAIAIFDRDARYVACNSRWIADYLPDAEDYVGLAHFDIFPEYQDKFEPLFERAFAGEKVSRDLDRVERRDGTAEWIRWSLTPWRDDKGNVVGCLARSEILTGRLEQQLQARLLSEELSLFIDIADRLALCLMDDSGLITIWTDNARRKLGWTGSEVLGRPFDVLFPPDERDARLPQRQLRIARESGTFRDRCWRMRADGSRFLAEITISRLEGDGQLPGGYGQMIRDVTDEDVQSRTLEASTVLLQSILETVPDAMIVIDESGLIVSFSKAAEELFGYTRDEVVGSNVSILMASPESERHDGYIRRYLETGERRIIGSSRRVFGRRKDGTTFPHELCVGEAFGGGRRLFAGFLHDLSEKEETEARLQELQRELAHIARVNEMGALASVLAHELNQPLMAIGNVVQTSADLIANGDALDRSLAASALGEAGKQAMRAGEIIKRLRNFMSHGQLEKTLEDPGNLAREAASLATTGARFREIECRIKVAEGTPPVTVDRIQIQQVIVNLVRNAIEAIGRHGSILISIAQTGPMVIFKVEDSGHGVPPERVPSLFQPFTTSKPAGMGLGLAICRTIVEAHGGKLWYEDAAGGGAVFAFTLPASAAAVGMEEPDGG